ncbi:hypothetical protein GDO86_016128 [Hymenochirus boettgeri]|uniref:Uncharacterized protein n=1 Tax=Hymenochirus boettgeri TaxID=247094 RepID=A0A8T2K141_9PIPI|nr:hypothetical protein GDO86_016128 [Hymenochirus boettgeri]
MLCGLPLLPAPPAFTRLRGSRLRAGGGGRDILFYSPGPLGAGLQSPLPSCSSRVGNASGVPPAFSSCYWQDS